ncbi:hypothetical protein CCP3SC1_450007 [Gammaproteobacteria bacterium]
MALATDMVLESYGIRVDNHTNKSIIPMLSNGAWSLYKEQTGKDGEEPYLGKVILTMATTTGLVPPAGPSLLVLFGP